MSAAQAGRRHRNCGTIPGGAGEGNKLILQLSDFSPTPESILRKSHLEQTEPARAELVLALTVLKGEKLNELVDEYWV